MLSEGCHVYLKRHTGELPRLTSEEPGPAEGIAEAAGDGEMEGLEGRKDPGSHADWQRELICRAVEASTHWLALPDQFEFHEYASTERFRRGLRTRR